MANIERYAVSAKDGYYVVIDHERLSTTPPFARVNRLDDARLIALSLNQPEGAVSLDDPRLIETLASVIENRHGTLHGIGSTLREAIAELKRGQ
jgi:hypothetical protein